MDPVSLASIAAAAVVVPVLAALLLEHRGLERRLREARAEIDQLRSRLDALSEDIGAPGAAPRAPGAAAGRATPDFLITRLPTSEQPVAPPPDGPVTPLTGREFASVALGESLLRLATLASGVRRAASAENRNRIGFEVRREIKRSRRRRRAETRAALRANRQPGSTVLTEDAA